MIVVLVPSDADATRNPGPGVELELDPEEVHHLRVRRVADGPVAVRDGAGLVGEGSLVSRGRRRLVELVTAERQSQPPALVLAVGAGDRERFALLAEKAAELGVTRLVPLETERSRSVGGRLRPDQLDRVRRRALDALKQSGAAWAPVIPAPLPLAEFLGPVPPDRASGVSPAAAGYRLLADAAGGLPPAAIEPAAAVSVLVGPEGGFTPAEHAAATAAGYVPTGLGRHVLRFETAAIAAAVAVNIARQRGAA